MIVPTTEVRDNVARHPFPPPCNLRPWFNLACHFEEETPPVSLTFTPKDIAKLAAMQLGLPKLAQKMEIKLMRVDVWCFAGEEKAIVDLDVYPFPGLLMGPPKPREAWSKSDKTTLPGILCTRHQLEVWPHRTSDSDGNNTVTSIRDKSLALKENARCSYIFPGIMAAHPLSARSNALIVSAKGNNQQKRVVRFHILWRIDQQQLDQIPTA